MVQLDTAMTIREMPGEALAPSVAADAMMKVTEPQFIETTVGEVAAELARRGIAPDRNVTITVEPDDWLAEVRRWCQTQNRRRPARAKRLTRPPL